MQPDRRAAAERRVGAGPRVADRDDAGGDRVAVDDEAAVPVLDAGHHVDAGDRFAVRPVRGERVSGQRRVPAVRVAQAAQRLVPAAGGEHDAPGAVVGGQREDPTASRRCCSTLVSAGRVLAGARPEVPAVVDEAAVLPLLDGRRAPAAASQAPSAERRPPQSTTRSARIAAAVRGEHAGHPRHRRASGRS